jgi:hypothetical protein
LADVVGTVFIAGHVALTRLGRSMPGTKVKNAIKRVDRLLGNVHLHSEIALFYIRLVARVSLAGERRPILLIDWTDIGTLWTALTVTLVTQGRGLVVWNEVHPRRKTNNPNAETAVLRRLHSMLPSNCKPILVSDAGFRGPWLRKVVAQDGWDFIGRVRGRVLVRQARGPWVKVKRLWTQATQRPKVLGVHRLAKYLPFEASLVCVWKNRSKKSLPAAGRRKKHAIRSAREPWILATSMKQASAADVVSLYGLRMRIEQTFRDQKCPKFGWGLDQVRTKSRERVSVYMLIATLAHYIAVLVGMLAEQANIHLDYQANTTTSKRVLSLARLGYEIIRRGLSGPAPWEELRFNFLAPDIATYQAKNRGDP